MTNDADIPAQPQARSLWPIAVAAIVIAAIIAGTVLFIFLSVRKIPTEAAQAADALVREVVSIAEAFRRGTVETTFASYATTVTGTSRLQVTTLHQTEVFTRRDDATLFWGVVELPEIIVSATAPVEYTAYVDFSEPWHFELRASRLRVIAPPIRFNTPSIDLSQIRYEVEADSLLRDEDAALEELERGLTVMVRRQAQTKKPLVQETSRQQVEQFVRIWLIQTFSDADEVDIDVVFANELDRETRISIAD